MRRILLALPAAMLASPALAQATDFCADRPGLGTPGCTMPPGQVMIELGVAGWDHLADPASTEDDLTYGDLLVRAGLDDRTELQIGLGGYTTTRSRDRLNGVITRWAGLGDLSLGLRRSLSGPGGPVAVQVTVILPTGHSGIGAGDWSAAVQVPIAVKLPAGFELDLTPEADAAANSSGKGRHLVWGGVAGLSHAAGSNVTVEAEIGAWRDGDPAGHATDARGAISLAWHASKDWQLDLEGDAGLTAAAPRRSLMFGLARRF